MTEEELLAEEYICNGKCQDDITRNYVHCKTCTRLKDFLAGYKVGKTDLERENVELKELLEACKQERIEALYRNEQYIKENAELKKRVDNLYNSDCWASEQLTKAKELLKQWLQTSKASSCDNINIVTDTEQFLSEVENVCLRKKQKNI